MRAKCFTASTNIRRARRGGRDCRCLPNSSVPCPAPCASRTTSLLSDWKPTPLRPRRGQALVSRADRRWRQASLTGFIRWLRVASSFRQGTGEGGEPAEFEARRRTPRQPTPECCSSFRRNIERNGREPRGPRQTDFPRRPPRTAHPPSVTGLPVDTWIGKSARKIPPPVESSNHPSAIC